MLTLAFSLTSFIRISSSYFILIEIESKYSSYYFLLIIYLGIYIGKFLNRPRVGPGLLGPVGHEGLGVGPRAPRANLPKPGLALGS